MNVAVSAVGQGEIPRLLPIQILSRLETAYDQFLAGHPLVWARASVFLWST